MKRSSVADRACQTQMGKLTKQAVRTERLHKVDFRLSTDGVPAETAGQALNELDPAAALLPQRFELLCPEDRAAGANVSKLDVWARQRVSSTRNDHSTAMSSPPSLNDLCDEPRKIASAT